MIHLNVRSEIYPANRRRYQNFCTVLAYIPMLGSLCPGVYDAICMLGNLA